MVWTRDESGAPYERGLIRFCVRPGAGHTPKRVCRRDLPLYANSMVGGRRRHLAAAASPSYGTVGALGLFLRRILLSTTAAFGIPAFSFLCQRIRQDSRDVRRQTQEPTKRPREAVLGAERKRSRRGPPPLPCYWPKAENLPGTPALGRAWIVEIRKNRMSPIFFLPSSFLSSRVAAPGRVGLFLKGVKRVAASRPVGLGDGPARQRKRGHSTFPLAERKSRMSPFPAVVSAGPGRPRRNGHAPDVAPAMDTVGSEAVESCRLRMHR